jgi:hypothetical protein
MSSVRGLWIVELKAGFWLWGRKKLAAHIYVWWCEVTLAPHKNSSDL